MRSDIFIALGLAIVCALGATVLVNRFINNDSATISRTIVVASDPLEYGTPITELNVRMVDWHAAALPEGSFQSINGLLADGQRVVLTTIAPGEPILTTKITGPGQRASLSAMLSSGMKAATIRVDDVRGVAGFVMPGDRVDVLLTNDGRRKGIEDRPFSDVLIQNARVLAVDQTVDEGRDKPAVAKAVTVEVTLAQAQKITLAGNLGTLSLVLRDTGSRSEGSSYRVTVGDLGNIDIAEPQKPAPTPRRPLKIGVTRGTERTEYDIARRRPVTGNPSQPASVRTIPSATRDRVTSQVSVSQVKVSSVSQERVEGEIVQSRRIIRPQ